MRYNLVYNYHIPLYADIDRKDGAKFDQQVASSIQKSLYFLLKKKMGGEEISEERFKKQFGNIYYKNMTAIDIIESETHHPLSQSVSFTKALDLALQYYEVFDAKAFQPLIVDTTAETKIGDFMVQGDIHLVGELKNNRRGRNIEVIHFANKKMSAGTKDNYFTRNNLWLNFASHVIRQELNAAEDLSTVYSLSSKEKHTITRIDNEAYYRFVDLVQYTCSCILGGHYPIFVSRRKCSGCPIKNICENFKLKKGR